MRAHEMWHDLSEEDQDVVLRLEFGGCPREEALHLIWSTRLEPDTELSTTVSGVVKPTVGALNAQTR